jgi:Protein of unknown function (DUF4239)
MNLYWVYDLPNWLFAALVVITCLLISLGGHRLTERWVKRIAGNEGEFNDLVVTTLATVGVFFGITLGLISVGVWEQFAQTNSNVGNEASALGVLYQAATVYPDDTAYRLKFVLEDYTSYIIDQAWPLQRQGLIPQNDAAKVNEIMRTLAGFEPVTEAMKILHAETLTKFNEMIAFRNSRLASVASGLPETLWGVVIIGATINLIIPWFLVYDRRFIQYIMIGLMAGIIGVLIFLVGAMDNPFRGEFSIGSDPFKLVHMTMKVAEG